MPEDPIITEKTKIQLSEDELLLMQNSEWILTKNSIIEKISCGFGGLAGRMQQHILRYKKMHAELILVSTPKISRGEKYQGLPYVILDYPRIFGKEDILAIRTLFWWGNYCSTTLHVKGIWKEMVLKKMLTHLDEFNRHFCYMSFSGDEWGHDLLQGNYAKFPHLSREQIIESLWPAKFLKIALKVEIGSWNNVEEKLFEQFLQFDALIKT